MDEDQINEAWDKAIEDFFAAIRMSLPYSDIKRRWNWVELLCEVATSFDRQRKDFNLN